MMKFGLIIVLLVSVGCGGNEPDGTQTSKEKTSPVLAVIDIAIAKTGDAKLKDALGKMRACVEKGDGTLALGNSQLGTVPPEIGLLSKLQVLGLKGNLLTELPPEIGMLKELKTLYLSKNRLTTLPPEIAQLVDLEVLSLDDNQMAIVPREIGKCTKLKRLTLSRNQVTALPAEIGDLTNLEKLFLGENQISSLPPEFGKLAKLEMLLIDSNPITDDDLKLLKSLKNLSHLGLFETKVTDDGVAALKQALPNCQIIR